MQGATAAMLPDGRRLHLQHGPIDLIVEAWGEGRQSAYARAIQRFETVLDELVEELSVLRRSHVGIASVSSPVARRMVRAVAPFTEAAFVTPMAAVAGAVADEILATLVAVPGIDKAYVNNGGDIAFHLGPGATLTAAVAAEPPARVTLSADHPTRGIATSGWQGRSHSLGIADSVTVLATGAATADAAATLIANAVDMPGHPGIGRRPARDLSPDNDLGKRLVTIDVPTLSPEERAEALQRGTKMARAYFDRSLIHAAYLVLQGETQTVTMFPELAPAD